MADLVLNEALAPIVLQDTPLVTECPLAALRLAETPNDLFYIRNHFPTTPADAHSWRLQISGLVRQPLTLSLAELQAMPPHDLIVTLQCAGFARRFLPAWAEGNQFGYGPVSTATFRGVRLADILRQAELNDNVCEIVFTGVDQGEVDGKTLSFARSLTRDVAMQPDILLAWLMNGEPIPLEHGYPLRLIVPQWYGVASVKWLSHIEALDRPFKGKYQSESYMIYPDKDSKLAREALTTLRPMSLILSPSEGERLKRGHMTMSGIAWSGAALNKVEVSADGGQTWHTATLGPDRGPAAWRTFSWEWSADQAGPVRLMSRATDSRGQTQPPIGEWNRLGYGNNAMQTVEVTIE